jgi:hypothetical protein
MQAKTALQPLQLLLPPLAADWLPLSNYRVKNLKPQDGNLWAAL